MKVKAAVLRQAGQPYTIEELELEAPREREVLVKYAYTGYCHTDLHFALGELNIALPMVAGHECAGVVEEVGPGVTTVKKGDHVCGTWMVPCGRCPACRKGMGHICQGNFGPFMAGTMLDGTTRFTDQRGDAVQHCNFVSGFSSHSVIPEDGVVPIANDFPLDVAALMSCCIPTGWGAVYNSANVKPGDSVAVWGLGGVGLNIVRAARMRQAYPVIAVDLEEGKEDLAKEFGATHFICNAREDPVPLIQKLTCGGADVAFEAIGDAGAIGQTWWAIAPAGKLVVVGVTPEADPTSLPFFVFPVQHRQIIGSLYGWISTHVDIPKLVRTGQKEDVQFDKLIGR
ncbi:MAG: alcohol dehydrogenase catalytic domain-containing protein, partial [Actinobacteria bacterium]|nr:alcohol dehydrogenase catalytic domain-containing protein [Actinomycetota bacterium]